MAGILTAAVASTFGANADPYFEYTTLLLPGNGTNGAQNNTFLDGSTNNFTITRNGNTTQGTFSPFSQTGWGNYFDGTGDYLSVPDNAALEFGSSNFTLEFWYYPVAEESLDALVTKGWPTVFAPFLIAQGSAGRISLYASTNGSSWDIASDVAFGTGIALNAWHHVVMTRSGNTLGLFVDGVRGNTVDVTAKSFQNNTYNLTIGASVTGSNAANTYVSNFRMVVGSSVYDPTQTTLTVPTSPLTAITNTQLLTCQSNRFRDASTNNFTITRNGDTSVVAFSPFNPTASWSAATNGGSGYFDGSGDYLSVASTSALGYGTGDFTIEFWYYPTSLAVDKQLWDQRVAGSDTLPDIYVSSTGALKYYTAGAERISGGTVTVNQWQHIALSKASGTTRLFLNGGQVGSNYTDSNNYGTSSGLKLGTGWNVGDFVTGYIADARALKGTGYSTITVPTAPLTAITNTSLLLNFTNAGIYDATSKNDLETVGNAQLSNAVTPKWGSTSIKFDGTGDSLLIPPIPVLEFGGGDFTIEFWFYSNSISTYQALIDRRSSVIVGGLVIDIYLSAVILNVGDANTSGWEVGIASSSLSSSTWYHVACTRSGSSWKMFVNGTQQGSTATWSGTPAFETSALRIGSDTSGANSLNGYMQDIRITKGYARYTSNFTAPTSAFPTL